MSRHSLSESVHIAAVVPVLSLALAGIATAQSSTGSSLTEFTLGDSGTLTVYGSLNLGALNYDDGQERDNFGLLDNSNAPSRAGLLLRVPLTGETRFSARGELALSPNPSSAVSFENPHPGDYTLERTDIRKLEVWLETDRSGVFWFGQGSMASDGISEIDLSGTSLISYSAATDTSGSFLLLREDGADSDITVASTYSNLDGSRRGRIRYDTPEVANLVLSAAYGQEVLADDNDNDYADVALRYLKETEVFELAAGVGYNWVMAPSGGDDREFYSGSASVAHMPTGLSLTVAGGTNVGEVGSFGFAKLGYERDFFPIGGTAFSIDYARGNTFVGDDSEMDTWALAVVQDWKRANIEFYALIRQYDFSQTDRGYETGQAVFAGLRWSF